MIKLLLVDDLKEHRILAKIQIVGSFDDVEVTALAYPPEDLHEVLQYDGMVIDEHLAAGVLGVNVARDIHLIDWRFPMMLYTSNDPRSVPNAMAYVDYVCSKFDNDHFGQCLRAWIRQIGRLKDARAT